MKPHSETLTRSLSKTISWRIIIVITDFILIYLLTGRVELAAGFAGIKFIIAAIIYFLHERVWNSINWGKS